MKTRVIFGKLEEKSYLQRLVLLRKRAGLSQTDVAGKLNIDYSTLGKIEKGDISLSVDRAMALAKIYGVTISQLLEGNGDKEDISMVAEDTERYRNVLGSAHITFKIGGEGDNSPQADRFLSRLGKFLMEDFSPEELERMKMRVRDNAGTKNNEEDEK